MVKSFQLNKLICRKFFLTTLVAVYSCANQGESPQFTRVLKDQDLLNGKWYLYQKIIPEIKTIDSIYPIDSTSYRGNRLNIDTEKMLFSVQSYPYNIRVSKYRMLISQDTIKIKSGAFQKGMPMFKNSYTFMISKDAKHLRVFDLKENNLEIYHKR
jgi:hypothetical protein